MGFLYLKVSEIRAYLADNSSVLIGPLPRDALSTLTHELTQLGIEHTVEITDHSYRAPVNPAGETVRLDPSIEDAVVQRMLDAGISFEHFEEG